MQPPACPEAARPCVGLVAPGLLLLSVLLSACATLPSQPTGSSEPAFTAASEIPRRVMLRTEMVGQNDPVGSVLGSELPRLGFTVDYEDPDGAFVAGTRRSDFGPSSLELVLVDERSGRVLWSAHIVRDWDTYASTTEAYAQNARKALELLERDLARVGFPPP